MSLRGYLEASGTLANPYTHLFAGGEYFRPHCDGSYETPDRKERTYFTLHLYLNNASTYTVRHERAKAPNEALIGGATTFHSYDMKRQYDVLPKAGRVLLFQHRDLLHSGDDVLRGTKYTMRTDLLYALESSKSEQRSKMPILEDEPVEAIEKWADGLAEATKYGYAT